MKKLITITIFSLILLLAACNKTETTSLRAYVNKNMEVKTTEVKFKVSYVDPEETLDNNDFTIKVSSKDDSFEEEVEIKKGREVTVTFDKLKSATEYTIDVLGTVDGKEVNLRITANKTFTTLIVGDIKEDPILIETTEDFIDMQPKKHYRLAKDIDFKGESLTPLFSAGTPFTGSFDGDGNSIKNINLTESKDVNKPYLSIFGYASKSIITNVTFDNIHINNDENSYSGIHYVGLVVSKVSNNDFEMSNITIKNSSLTIKHNVNKISTNRNLYVGLLGGSVQGKIYDIKIIDSELNVTQHGVNGSYAGTDISTTGTYVGGALGLVESDKGLGINQISVLDTTITVNINQDKLTKGSGSLYVGGVFGANRSDRKFRDIVADTKIVINHTNFIDPKNEDEEEVEIDFDKLDLIYVGGIGSVIKPNTENLYYFGEIEVNLDTQIKKVIVGLVTAQTNKSSIKVAASGSINISTDADEKTPVDYSIYNYRTNQKWDGFDDNVKLFNNPTVTVDGDLKELLGFEVIDSLDELIDSEFILNEIE